MKMLINEIRKEFLLAKKECMFMIIFDIIAIPFLSSRLADTGVIGSYMVFFMVVFITDMLIKNTISMNENKYERATSYLCSTPYVRRNMVLGKYAFDFVVFGSYSIIYVVEAIAFESVKPIPIWLTLVFLLILCIYQGVIIPMEFWLGYSKAKYVSTLSIMVIPFILPAIVNNIDFSNINLSFFNSLRTDVIGIAVVVVTSLVLVVSGSISLRIFKTKSL